MAELPESLRAIDWKLTTWEGNRRQQLRRWASLPLHRVIAALEEMEDLANDLASGKGIRGKPPGGSHARGER